MPGADGGDAAGLERVSGGAQWSPRGRRLVYEDARYGVRTMRADGRGKRTVTRRPIWPTWPPDGRRILLVRQYPADEHDRSDVDTIPAQGGRERRHFSSSRFIGRIDWQPRPRT